MNRFTPLTAAAILLFSVLGSLRAQTYIWTGIGNGWKDQLAPVNDGTADLVLGDSLRETIFLTGDLNINSVAVATNDLFYFSPDVSATPPLLLTLNSGASIDGFGRLVVDEGINLSLTGSPVFDAGSGAFVLSGTAAGSPTNVTLKSTGNPGGAFIFNNTSSGNAYTGTTTIFGQTGAPVTVALWNSSPFGSSSVNVTGAALFSVHGTQTVANAFTFNSSDAIAFRAWDAPLTLSGAVTLANNSTTILQSNPTANGAVSPEQQGVYPSPGAMSRHPVVFTGNIGESGGARTLQIGGAGLIILKPGSGQNTYTGGTTVNGSLVLGNVGAIPTTGTITINSTAGANGYAGIADVTAGNFAAFLAKITGTSDGAVGVDTLPGASSTTNLADAINLTGFSNANIRLGTATSAILSGVITPQGADYRFGNGGGSLYIASNLPNVSTVSSLVLDSNLNAGFVSPLKLYLQGSLGYTGGTTAYDGFIVFESPTLPNSGQLTAAGASNLVGTSYIGFAQGVDEAVSTFVGSFDQANTWGIVGFDTYSGDLTPAVFADAIDLTGFNDGVFIGTSSEATLTGTITPTTVGNANNAANTYRFTAGNGGHLTVMSLLTGNRSVMIGPPTGAWAYADGIVSLLSNTNDYTGGTIINAFGPITLEVGGTSPLGTGALTFTTQASNTVGLRAYTDAYTLSNAILFPTPGVNENVTQLYLTGTNDITLAGTISGPGHLNLVDSSSLAVTLSGDNQAWDGELAIVRGTVNLAHNNAVGTSRVYFGGADAILQLTGAATAPVIHGLDGDKGSIVLPVGTSLTIDTSDSETEDVEFGGVISGSGSLVVTGAEPIDATEPIALYLAGSNTFSGGTSVTGDAYLGLGRDSSAGTGTVVLNAPGGGLALNTDVTFSNTLSHTAGTLMGLGTFNPAGLTAFNIGPGKAVSPGLPGLADIVAGKLTLAKNTTFDSGGTMVWSMQDSADIAEGVSKLFVTGDLTITASPGSFTLRLISFDLVGDVGFSAMNWGQAYSFTLVETSGSILGFDPAAFAFDVADFQGGLMDASLFSVTATGNSLVLNFTAVPEPSTYALLALGSGWVLATLRRRRRI